MKCADPTLCYISDSKKQYRSYSMASALFKSLAKQVFSCGKCIFCRKKKATELAIRCVLHASLYKDNCFLTLTYDEKKEGYNNTLSYDHIQKFKKRLRRHYDYHFDRKIQIFNVHEYGKNGKKHWHLVAFNMVPSDATFFTVSNGNPLYISPLLQSLWPYGHHSIGSVTEASAMYQSQYMQKDFQHGYVKSNKASHSKHSGIGRDYFLANYDGILSLGYIPFGGKKIPIPRYFEKLAHKHYSHFYAPENFQDFTDRKKLYTKFKPGQANKHLAELYRKYSDEKKLKVEQLTAEWETFIIENIYDPKPDFMKSAENFLYDLRNKTTKDF
ncbi:MAG: replication initiator protein [Arizlama microvirus]|nr:MAG: replication initiator protein [Arizlama microvirus]